MAGSMFPRKGAIDSSSTLPSAAKSPSRANLLTIWCFVETLLKRAASKVYEDHQTDDQVAACRRPGGAAPGPGGPARLFVEVLAQGLYPAPVVRRPGPKDLPQGRLPGRRPAPGRLRRAAPGPGAVQGPRP